MGDQFERILKIIGMIMAIIMPILSFALAASIPFVMNQRGTVPPKAINVTYEKAIDLRTLPMMVGEGITADLKINEIPLDNAYKIDTSIQNIGSAPILPTDIYENLSIITTAPWKIIAIGDRSKPSAGRPELKWAKISDTEFQAAPALINPSDYISITVYLTNPNLAPNETLTNDKSPTISWGGRIANLKQFAAVEQSFTKRVKEHWGIQVELYGWSLWYLILTFLSTEVAYLILLSHSRLLSPWRWYSYACVIVTNFIALASAEASATYYFGSYLTDIVGVDNWLNAPWIILNAVGLIFLAFYSFRISRQPAEP